MSGPRIAFAGDRAIAVRVLDHLLDRGIRPDALLVSAPERESHAAALRERTAYLPEERVLVGDTFRSDRGIDLLRGLGLRYVVAVHFPYVVPRAVLSLPSEGVLNLHPAYLPYNRGWHTPSWALLDGTPYGATLHFMDEGIDSGDIVLRRRLEPRPDDTADSLYRRVLDLELELFREAWPSLEAGDYPRAPQDPAAGTAHRRSDLREVQRLELGERMEVGSVLRRLRALTTSSREEAAWFESGGRRYRVQVRIEEEPSGARPWARSRHANAQAPISAGRGGRR